MPAASRSSLITWSQRARVERARRGRAAARGRRPARPAGGPCRAPAAGCGMAPENARPAYSVRARLAHRGRGRGQVLDVVQRVVQPEDLDAALGGAEDEAAHQVVGQRPRADQEPAAQRHLQRRVVAPGMRSARTRSQGLSAPRLTAASKQPPPRHLERAEAGAVQDLGHLQHAGGRQRADQRGLGQQPEGGVDDPGHARADVAGLARVDTDHVADVDEQRHLDDGAGLERRRLGHVGHRVALDARLGVGDRQLDRRRQLQRRGLPSTVSSCTVSFSRMKRQLLGDHAHRQRRSGRTSRRPSGGRRSRRCRGS